MSQLVGILLAVVRCVADWLLMAARVREMLTNDLPHLETAQQRTEALARESRELIVQQIAFCKGRVSVDAPCPRPSTLNPQPSTTLNPQPSDGRRG